jgi:site-specific recombinase XerD
MPKLHAVPGPDGSPSGGDYSSFVRSWKRSLRARNLSPKTIVTYEQSALQFGEFLTRTGGPPDVASITREHVENFITELLRLHKPTTASVRTGPCSNFSSGSLRRRRSQPPPCN